MAGASVVECPAIPGFLCSTTIVFLRSPVLLAVLLVGCSLGSLI